MRNLMIKICGITDPEIAKKAANMGANYIGIIFHPGSPRFVTLNQAAEIALAAENAGALAVAVFVDQSAYEMQSICEAANIRTVQLHGAKSKQQHHQLPADYQRIYVQFVTQSGEMIHDSSLKHLDQHRDLVLIDHIESGKGKTFDWLKFKYKLACPWLLAGGLSSHNVDKAVKVLKPNGVDVSSGVEFQLGKKDSDLIETFIKTVRGQHAQ